MNIKMLRAVIAGLILSVSGFANAGLISFELEWSGDAFGNNAYANGLITIDDEVFVSPGSNNTLGTNWVHDFELTLNGEGYNNTFFDFDDTFLISLNSLVFLDLTQELVGQNNWGTCYTGECGDFNFIVQGAISPNGFFEFRTANGESLQLTSFTPTQVPEPSTLVVFALGMIGLASGRFKKKS